MAARLLALDPRLKLAWVLLAGALIWLARWPGLAAWGLVLALLFLGLRPFWPGTSGSGRAGLAFVLVWVLVKAGLGMFQGEGPGPAIQGALLLGLRLLDLVLLGLVLALSTPPRQSGLALAWAARPLLGRRAWEPALALALMVHFLPLCWEVMAQVRRGIEFRCGRLSFVRRSALFASAVLRVLGRSTWEQTLAVASRGLDQEGAWRGSFAPLSRDWLAALGILGLLAALSAL